MWEKIKTYADLARVHGMSVTASMSMLGALTSTAGLDLATAFRLVVIAFFTHISLNALNELRDVSIDSQIPESSMKPLVRGAVSPKRARDFVIVSSLALFVLLFLFFPEPPVIIVFFMSYIWLIWYCSGVGKRISYSFDISFAMGYPFYALFGTFAADYPTIHTWMLMGAMVAISLASQWSNGLKDVEADRKFGVKSIAVLWNISSNNSLTHTNPFFMYGIFIKALLLFFCFLAYFMNPSLVFLLFIICYGIPSQIYLVRRYYKDKSRLDLRKTMLYDALLMWFLLCSTAFGNAGILPILFISLFMIAGYIVASRFESGAEWKFGRYSTSKKQLYEPWAKPSRQLEK